MTELHKIQQYAKNTNKTITDLAHEIGISRAFLYMIMEGSAYPSIETCIKINEVTGLSLTIKNGKLLWS